MFNIHVENLHLQKYQTNISATFLSLPFLLCLLSFIIFSFKKKWEEGCVQASYNSHLSTSRSTNALYMYIYCPGQPRILTGTANLKLKTIHKCFLCPYKRQNIIMLCFIPFKLQSHDSSNCRVTIKVKRDLHAGKIIYYTNYQVLRIHVLVLSFLIIWHAFLFCFPIVITTLLHGCDFIQRFTCVEKCATFLGARTPRNAMKRCIELCNLYIGAQKDIYEQSSALTRPACGIHNI